MKNKQQIFNIILKIINVHSDLEEDEEEEEEEQTITIFIKKLGLLSNNRNYRV